MKQYINYPDAESFWDLSNDKIRKAHQDILRQFELVMDDLRKQIKSGEFEFEWQREQETDSMHDRMLSADSDSCMRGEDCAGLCDLFYWVHNTISDLYQPDRDGYAVTGDGPSIVAAIARAYILLAADLYFVNNKINTTLRLEASESTLIYDDLANMIYKIAEHQASRNQKALPQMNKAELIRYLEKLSIEDIRKELHI